jgi:hypothetical protein
MSQPLLESIPHRLGRQEAKRRLDGGIRRLRPELGGLVSNARLQLGPGSPQF